MAVFKKKPRAFVEGYEAFAPLVIDFQSAGGIDPRLRRTLEHARTLVLNADYQPLSVMPPSVQTWTEAVRSIWKGTVTPHLAYEGIAIRSPTVTVLLPSVVVSSAYVAKDRTVLFSKSNLCVRDGYSCQYCRAELDYQHLTQDHVVPRSAGGKTVWDNIVMACETCNARKGSGRLMKPIRAPYAPSRGQLEDFARRQPITVPDPRWAPLLGWKGAITVQDPLTLNHYKVDSNGDKIKGRDEGGDEIGY